MQELRSIFTDEDFLFLIKVLMPDVDDKQRMIRVLREDEEILEGMLADEKLHRYLLDDPLSVLRVSPALFFAILLVRVKFDLQGQSYTFERNRGFTMALFDTPQILQLLEKKELLAYLTNMLVSFVRINSVSTAVRVRRGVWRRVRFSDFDIDNLLQYASAIDESFRFPVYKRIADICLFTLGIFQPAEGGENIPFPFQQAKSLLRAKRSRDEYTARGVSFYWLASRHKEAQVRKQSGVLSTLAEKFTLAAKPLSMMSSRYLEPFKDNTLRGV
jgi:hypothetical protein